MTSPKRPIVRYYGGKWRLAPWIIQHIPSHRIYVEPCAGAASVLLRKPRSATEVIADPYGRMVNLFKILRDQHLAALLTEQIRLTPYAETEYHNCQDAHPNEIEDARRMMVIGHQGHTAVASAGGRLSGWRRGIRERGAESSGEWRMLPAQLHEITERLQGVFIEQSTALDTIERWDNNDTFFYVDPPYVADTRKTRDGYKHEMTEADHTALAHALNHIKGQAIISGYRSDLYEELYKGWQRIDRRHNANAGCATVESIWLSPGLHTSQMKLFEESA